MLVDSSDEQLLLDLLNSTPRTAGVSHDLLEETEAWQAWLRSGDSRGSKNESKQTLTAARSALQSVVRGEQPASVLAPYLQAARWAPKMTDDGIEWTLEAPAAQRLAVRAVLAWDEVRATKPGRLRACENPECDLFLLDRSKSNSARWCSMASCGNRMKARRYYQSKSGAVEPPRS